MKKKILFGVACALALCCSLCVVNITSFAEETKRTEYKYALLGETYVVGNGFTGGKTPKGEIIEKTCASVFLDWASGSYVFEYTDKTVSLKVYEKAPADEIRLAFDMPESVTTGETVSLPSATVKSGIKRTDGAPAVADYKTKACVMFGNKKVAAFSGDEMRYKFDKTGEYVVSYEYTDVFGKERSIGVTVVSENKPKIVGALKSNYALYEKIDLSAVYGLFDGAKHAVSVTVTEPSGSTVNPAGYYRPQTEGAYVAAVSCELGGVRLEKSFSFDVKTELSPFISDYRNASEAVSIATPENVFNRTETASLIKTLSQGASFSYNGVVDLREIPENSSVVSFLTNVSGGYNVSAVKVTMTDVYDEKNTLSVSFRANSDMTATTMTYDNAFVQVSYGGVNTAFNNYYYITDNSVAWENSFYTYWNSAAYENENVSFYKRSIHPFNFRYDTETNSVYSYGNYTWINHPGENKSGTDWYLIANLSDEKLSKKFGGFTTGEVYLTLSVTEGSGDVAVLSIGGKTADGLSTESFSEADGILTGAFDCNFHAVKGVEYKLPEIKSTKGTEGFTTTLTSPSGKKVDYGEPFVPTEVGVYKLVCAAYNVFGNQVKKTLEITCDELPTPIGIDYELPSAPVVAGSAYEVAVPEVYGGNGKVTYSVFFNGAQVKPGDTFVVSGESSVTVKATDELGFANEKTFDIPIDSDNIRVDVAFPRTAVTGSVFTVPDAVVYDYKTGSVTSYEVYYNGSPVSGDSVTLPNEPCKTTFEYRVARGKGVSYTLNVVDGKLEKSADALLFEGGALTTDAGTVLELSKDAATVSTRNMVSANAVEFSFIVLVSKLNFDTVTCVMTGEKGLRVEFAYSGLTGDSPFLTVNGVPTGKTVAKKTLTYSSESTSEFAGEAYLRFTMSYNDLYRAVMDDTRIKAVISSDINGLPFSGFGGGVYLDFVFSDITGDKISFAIDYVGNQQMSEFAFQSGDITAPQIYSPFRLANSITTKGTVLELDKLRAFDVMQGEAEVTVSLYDNGGACVYDGVSASEVKPYTLANAGTCRLIVRATDAAGIIRNTVCVLTVEDSEPPVVTVPDGIPETAVVGGEFVLGDITAADDDGAVIEVWLFSPDGNPRLLAKGENSVSGLKCYFSESGVYLLNIKATDGYGNTSSLLYSIVAENK